MRDLIFSPRPVPFGTSDPIAWTAIMGAKREGGLELLKSFLDLANISVMKLPERKPWETSDKEAAIEKMRREQLGEVLPPPLVAEKPLTPES
jgi:hypothetical protein